MSCIHSILPFLTFSMIQIFCMFLVFSCGLLVTFHNTTFFIPRRLIYILSLCISKACHVLQALFNVILNISNIRILELNLTFLECFCLIHVFCKIHTKHTTYKTLQKFHINKFHYKHWFVTGEFVFLIFTTRKLWKMFI